MRSSKSRSRSKQNRPRSLGNIINRVFDSSGPEGKVRGTPQQIIEKYQVLARDAQLSNDRVAAENFLQHAEHYTRLLAEAQREMIAEQEARQQQYQQTGNGNGGNGNAGLQGGARDRDGRDFREPRESRDRGSWRDDRPQDPGAGEQPDVPVVIDLSEDSGTGLVETPETRDAAAASAEAVRREDRSRREDRGRRDRRDRSPRPDRDVGAVATTEAPEPSVPEAVPEPVADAPAAKPRRPRAPRKSKASEPETEGNGDPREAAE